MSLIDFLFPKSCLNCKKSGCYICIECLKRLGIAKQKCPYCKRYSIDGITHTKCKRRWGIDGLIAIWPYQGIVRKAILNLKYKFAFEIAKELAESTSKYLKENLNFLPKDIILVPIPLYTLRKNWRGFNQAEEIGKLISENVGWDYCPNLIIRKKATKPQVGLNARKRYLNVKGVFEMNQGVILDPKKIILLFDDVWTTGSTMKEACRILKRNGCKVVWGLTIAR